MNKRKFLKELEKRLILLEETEKQDILNEYKDIIEEKVKRGKTEEEAIADFGSIDELSKEILKAYKINSEYLKDKQSTSSDKAKEIINNSEDLIKEGARKLSKFTRNVFDDIKKNNSSITIETIFEIIIKSIIMLVGFVILRIPFSIIKGLGKSILDMAFVPFDSVLNFIWSGIIGILYFITCIVIAILVFKQYFKTEGNNTKKKHKTNNLEKEIEKVEEAIEKIEKEEKYEEVKEIANNNGLTSVISIIVKILVITFFLIPIFFINLGLSISLVCLIFLLYKGLNVIGLVAIIIGLIIIFGNFSSIITKFLYNRTKVYFFPFIIGIIFLITGSLISMDKAIEIDFHDTLPTNSFERKMAVYSENIDKRTFIIGDDDIEMVVDNSLEDGKINVEVTYYNDLVNIERIIYCSDDYCDIRFSTYYHGNNKKKLIDLIINELKKNRVYNYAYFFKPEIKVFANENTMKLVD